MSNNPPFTTGQVAEYCHVSQATIVNWIKEGKLNGYTTPGGHYRIPRADLLSFLRTHGMPIDATLKASSRPKVLVLSANPTIQDLVGTLGEKNGFEISLVASDYAASAEAVQSSPDAVIVDTKTSSDPLGLCRWLSEAAADASVLVIGHDDDNRIERAAGVDAYLPSGALSSLESELEVLLL
jgi:excisionase family DNA binding protein